MSTEQQPSLVLDYCCFALQTWRHAHGEHQSARPWHKALGCEYQELTTSNKLPNHLVDRKAVADGCDALARKTVGWESSKGDQFIRVKEGTARVQMGKSKQTSATTNSWR